MKVNYTTLPTNGQTDAQDGVVLEAENEGDRLILALFVQRMQRASAPALSLVVYPDSTIVGIIPAEKSA